MVLPFPLLFSVAAEGYLDYSCSVHGGGGGAPGRGSPGSCFWRRTRPTRETINSQGPAKGLWLCLPEQAGLDRLVARGWVARESKAPSVVPAQAELGSGWSCSKAPAAPRAPRLSCAECAAGLGLSASFVSAGTKTRKASSPVSPLALEGNLRHSLGGAGGGPGPPGPQQSQPLLKAVHTPNECPLTHRSPVAR